MQKKQKPATRSRFYTDIGTKGWRQTGYDTYGFYSPGFRQWIGSQFPAKKKMILSVGCGTGELEKHLSELRHTVVGLDLSHPMLKRASRHGLDLLVQADAYSLPFRAAQFDVMMLMESIGYLEPAKVFAEARRVLRKRGRLMITTYAAPVDAHARYRKWGMDEIANQLIDAGFRTDEQRYLAVKKISVREVASEDRSGLLYLSSTAMS
jgi:ubiquinone/menaquinone biosynthesis C-methylase UbiE